MRVVGVEVIGPEKHGQALLEMRTAPLETRTAKSMRLSGKNNFVAAKFCSLQNE